MQIRLFNGELQIGPINKISFHFGDGLVRHYTVVGYRSRETRFSAETYELETLTAIQEDPRGDFVNELLAKLPENYDDDASGEGIVHTWVDDQLAGNDRRISYTLDALRRIQELFGSHNDGQMMQALTELDELVEYLK
jgi:hypothetical protein